MSIEPPRRPATPMAHLQNPASAGARAAEPPQATGNQMLVGREVALSGKITGCDHMMVEGKLEAVLLECSSIEVAGPGIFKGTATVDQAEISGWFEGTLTVRKRLLIRASGQVIGTILYGQLEVECGGRLAGDVGSVGEGTPQK